jgi:hypothetical protein
MPPPSYDAVCALLRIHRGEMRIMYGFIADQDLLEDFIDATGNTPFYFLRDHPDLEPDGGEPPESRAWKAMACEQERFIQATQSLAQQKRMEEHLSRVSLDLERARMRAEDHRARPY